MHDLKWRSGLARGRQRPRERVERRRAQDRELHAAAHRIEAFEQRPGDHPVADVICSGWARDDHQHAQHIAFDREGLLKRRDRQAPADSDEIERDRRRAVGVAHELPWQPQEPRRGRPEHDLRRHVSIARLDIRVARRARAEDRGEHRLAPLRQRGRDPLAAGAVRAVGVAQVVLEVPAQVFELVVAQRPGQLERRSREVGQLLATLDAYRYAIVCVEIDEEPIAHHRTSRFVQCEIDTVAILPQPPV